MIDYETYIKSDAWKAKREKVLEFWGHQCATCCNVNELHVHHRTYERLGNELLTDLLPLCVYCHELFHEKMGRSNRMGHISEINDLFSQIIKVGYYSKR